MSPDGKRLLDEGQIVFDGTERHPTMEGPKMYKRNGYYYILRLPGSINGVADRAPVNLGLWPL